MSEVVDGVETPGGPFVVFEVGLEDFASVFVGDEVVEPEEKNHDDEEPEGYTFTHVSLELGRDRYTKPVVLTEPQHNTSAVEA